MRVVRPSDDAYPVVYDDEGRVISDPNAEHAGLEPEPPAETEPEDDTPKAPPRSAKKAAWVDYAEALGVDLGPDDTKEEIMAKLSSIRAVGGES